jgi:hypothetical protein
MTAISRRRSFSACSGLSMRVGPPSLRVLLRLFRAVDARRAAVLEAIELVHSLRQLRDFVAEFLFDSLAIEHVSQPRIAEQRRNYRLAVVTQLQHPAGDVDAARPALFIPAQALGYLGYKRILSNAIHGRINQERSIFIGETL